MKRTVSRDSSATGLDIRLGQQAKPIKRGFASLRTFLILAACLAGIILAAAAAFFLPGSGIKFEKEPSSQATTQQPASSAPIDLVDARAVIFEMLSRIGMDAGRYELDARHAPYVTLQGNACEITGEISLLNNPEGARPYYAIVRQSGPLTTLLILRVDGKVVYTRAEP
ncbi:hypothetical protein [Desulfocurvibacter africanus]|uniref:hypothetical protein n=1 Tax=Desulfocurvibacter africanus TaxID=873 RepID=UPI0004191D06|nr:hypothetical protein [Desulfocurvibacter africanus]